METIVEIINALPDEVRMLDLVYVLIRITASVFGLRFWEDGSVS